MGRTVSTGQTSFPGVSVWGATPAAGEAGDRVKNLALLMQASLTPSVKDPDRMRKGRKGGSSY